MRRGPQLESRNEFRKTGLLMMRLNKMLRHGGLSASCEGTKKVLYGTVRIVEHMATKYSKRRISAFMFAIDGV
jgi:hypothetical protein